MIVEVIEILLFYGQEKLNKDIYQLAIVEKPLNIKHLK